MNGYVILLLLLLSNIGALTQVLVGLLAIMTTGGAAMAYANIKRLQIDQHRAWMLRTWFYAGSIITLRLIMIISTLMISGKGFYRAMPCKEIEFIYSDKKQQGLETDYPLCFASNGTTDGWVAVKAQFVGGNIPQIGTGLGITFGTAGWLALFMHAVGVEIYLAFTPRENDRLRVVSYQRQLEAGFSHPGSAGLTSDRLGDSEPWEVPIEAKVEDLDGELELKRSAASSE